MPQWQALLQSLATVQAIASEGWVGRIPTAGQMLLGFILPFALAFIAIPLESLIHSSRSVGGVLLTAVVRSLALVLRVTGQAVRQTSRVLVRLYDVAIVVPLLAERMANRRGHFMPPSLLESQLAILEEPSPDEHAWVCDIRDTPETIVADLVGHAA